MSYTVTAQYFNFDRRGNAKPVKPGTVISDRDYMALPAGKQAKCVYNKPAYVPYQDSELVDIIALYLDNSNPATVGQRYMDANPDTEHTMDSVTSVAYQLRAMDVLYPGYTKWVVKTSTVERVALDVCPDRFIPANQIAHKASLSLENLADAVLATI